MDFVTIATINLIQKVVAAIVQANLVLLEFTINNTVVIIVVDHLIPGNILHMATVTS